MAETTGYVQKEETSPAGKRILVVEDEYLTSTDIRNTLAGMGYIVPGTADTAESAIRMAGEMKPDLVLMDITLKGALTGIDAARAIRDRYDLPVVYMTGHTDEATVAEAISANPFGYIVKPVDERFLNMTIRMALLKHAIEARLRQAEQTTRALLNAVPDGMMLLDNNGTIIAINETMAQLIGKTTETLTGQPVAELVASGILGITMDDLEDQYIRRIPTKHAGQREARWFETSLHPVTSPRDTVELVAIQSHDITDAKVFEESLKKNGIAQIEQNMEQFQILNDQIRNPLQVIKGYISLADFEYAEKINEQIRVIDELVTRLDRGWLESEKVRSFLYRHYRHGSGSAAGPGMEAS